MVAPIHELLYRFHVGDHKGALAAAAELLDRSLVPEIVVPPETLYRTYLEARDAALLGAIDGERSLDDVLADSNLPLVDALHSLCELLDRGLVALR